MKVVILCGGRGTRLVEETHAIPKPMIKIGDQPILWHIMKIFKYYGINDFILAAGYKKEIIEKFFEDCKDFSNVNVVDTGIETMTAGRI